MWLPSYFCHFAQCARLFIEAPYSPSLCGAWTQGQLTFYITCYYIKFYKPSYSASLVTDMKYKFDASVFVFLVFETGTFQKMCCSLHFAFYFTGLYTAEWRSFFMYQQIICLYVEIFETAVRI